jgi:hypothetical protein
VATPTVETLKATGRQYARQPVNIALLLILPPLFVLGLSSAIATFSGVLGGNLGERSGSAIGAVWAAALLSSSAAFFLLRASRQADDRLLIAGLGRPALYATHALAGAVLGVGSGTVGFLVVLLTQDIASPIDLWLAVVVGAVAYEAVGATLAFFVDGDLEGSFIILLVFMLDAFVAGPLGGATGFWPSLFPLHHPSQIAVDAALTEDVDRLRYGWAVVYMLILLGGAGLAHVRRSG